MRNVLLTVVAAMMALGLEAGPARADVQPPEPELYGLYGWAGELARFAEDIERSGIRWLRAGGWHRNGDPGSAERLMRVAAERGFVVQPVIELGGLSDDGDMTLDEMLERWREAIRAQVEPYAPGGSFWQRHPDLEPAPVRYWQIWNEPNIYFLGTEATGLRRDELYAELLAVAIDEVRRIDPEAYLIAYNPAGGALAHLPSPDVFVEQNGFVGWRRLIRVGNERVGPEAYDAVGIHPYTMPVGPEAGGVVPALALLRELPGMSNKPIWMTEVGYPIEYPRQRQVRDEAQQAAFVTRLFAIAGAHGVTQVQIMYVTDIVYSRDGSRRSFGFFPEPGEWREHAYAASIMRRLVPDPRVDVEILAQEPGGAWAYRFRGAGGEPVIMAWHSGGRISVPRRFDVERRQLTRVSMLGETSTIPAEDGQVAVTLAEAPIYLVAADESEVRQRIADVLPGR